MDFHINVDEYIEGGKKLKETAEFAKTATDNFSWELRLPVYEQYMLRDEEKRFMMKVLGLNEQEFNKFLKIRDKYDTLERLYSDDEVVRTRARSEMQVPYDLTITRDEAYDKYSEFDRETSRKISELVSKARTKTIFHVKDIRDNYTGDLSTQLGMNKEKYLAEEQENKKRMEAMKKKLDEFINRPDIQKKIEDFDKAIKAHNDLVNGIVEESQKKH